MIILLKPRLGTFSQQFGPQVGIGSDARIRATVRVLAVLVSSVLPIASIVVLYFIRSQAARLGAIVAFSALCSLALAVLSDARNTEIIATTSAYVHIGVILSEPLLTPNPSFAAVQVVFVSGNVTVSA